MLSAILETRHRVMSKYLGSLISGCLQMNREPHQYESSEDNGIEEGLL